MADKDQIKIEPAETAAKPRGKYLYAVGRRKTAIAQVRLHKAGGGAVSINGENAEAYFNDDLLSLLFQPLKLAGLNKDLNVSALVSGGGKKSQAEAVRHGLSRALLALNPELRPALKAKGYLSRDARKKERKKPGLKKARRAPQWAKR